MSAADVQQYVRIAVYGICGWLISAGITVTDNTKSMIAGICAFLANLAWTIYGTRLNGLLEQVKGRTGVVGIEIKTDPAIIPPSTVTNNTSDGITATPAK